MLQHDVLACISLASVDWSQEAQVQIQSQRQQLLAEQERLETQRLQQEAW